MDEENDGYLMRAAYMQVEFINNSIQIILLFLLTRQLVLFIINQTSSLFKSYMNRTNIFSRLFAAFLGIILYPVASFAINAIFTALSVLVMSLALIVSVGISAFSGNLKKAFMNAGLIASIILISVYIAPITAIAIGAVLGTLFLKDMIVGIYKGLTLGFKNGIKGFFSKFISEAYKNSFMGKLFKRIFIDRRGRDNGQRSINNHQPHQTNEVNLEEYKHIKQTSIKYISLNAKEIDAIEKLKSTDNKKLKKLYEQYTELKDKLDVLKESIDKRGPISNDTLKEYSWSLINNPSEMNKNNYSLDKPDDEVLIMELIKPILLYKEVKTTSGDWTIVPGSTRITDKYFFKNWLEKERTHPLTRENMDLPRLDPNTKQPTRYRSHSFQGYSKDLHQLTVLLRKELSNQEQLNQQEINSNTNVVLSNNRYSIHNSNKQNTNPPNNVDNVETQQQTSLSKPSSPTP